MMEFADLILVNGGPRHDGTRPFEIAGGIVACQNGQIDEFDKS